jgi:hypothetical protein
MRYYEQTQKVSFERFDLVKVISMVPLGYYLWKGSWMLNVGARSLNLEENSFRDDTSVFLKYAYGISYQLNFLPGNFLLFILPGFNIEGTSAFQQGYRLQALHSPPRERSGNRLGPRPTLAGSHAQK